MIFEFRNEIVTITPQGMILPEIKDIKGKSNYKDIIEYVFFVYDRNSIYNLILIDDRKKIIYQDKFNHLPEAKYAELDIDAKKLIDKLDTVQYTPNERLIKGLDDKIGEYLTFWQSVKIDGTNHKLVADTMERAEGLIRIKEKIEKMSSKENQEIQMGGAKRKMFE